MDIRVATCDFYSGRVQIEAKNANSGTDIWNIRLTQQEEVIFLEMAQKIIHRAATIRSIENIGYGKQQFHTEK